MSKKENDRSQKGNKGDNNSKISKNVLIKNVDLVFKRTDDTKKYNEFYLKELEKYVEEYLKKSITKTQMRNIFETFKSCKSNDEMELLKPKLMYFAGRINNNNTKLFMEQLIELIDKMEDENDYKHMQKLVESTLAYHKYYAEK